MPFCKRFIVPCYAILIFSGGLVADEFDKYDELDNEIVNLHLLKQSEQKEFELFLKNEIKQYTKWRSEYLKEFDQFQQSVVESWGAIEQQNKQRFVQFSENKQVKSILDLDKQEVKVEIIADKQITREQAQAKLQQAVNLLLKDKNSNISQLMEDLPNDVVDISEVSEESIIFNAENKRKLKSVIIKQMQSQAQEIDKQFDRSQFENGNMTSSEAKLLAVNDKQQLLKDSQKRLSTAGKNYDKAAQHAQSISQSQKIISYTVKLPENILSKRARKYVPLAEKESEIYGVPAALVMAIMHSESAFDPNAKSPVPAYGLMQIVPHTAGHDVNKLYRKIDKPMNKKELYVPEVNVETGTAYLAILDQRYLKKISNPQNRLYCTIAAYNTGAGNVARVFNQNGSRNINQAAIIINQLTPKQVYQRLLDFLPYDETKHYLERVNGRIALYAKL